MKKAMIALTIFVLLLSNTVGAIMAPPLIEIEGRDRKTVIISIKETDTGLLPETVDILAVCKKSIGRCLNCEIPKLKVELTETAPKKDVAINIIPDAGMKGSYQIYISFKTAGNAGSEARTLILATFPGGEKKNPVILPEIVSQKEIVSKTSGKKIPAKTVLKTNFTNGGGEEYYTVMRGEIKIRDDSKKLVKTLRMKIDETVFPNREKPFSAEIPQLANGNYTAEVIFNISWPTSGGKRVLKASADLQISEEFPETSEEIISPLTVDKTELTLETWIGNTKKFSVQLKNSGSEEINDLKITTPEWIQVLSKFPNDFVLEPGKSIVILFLFKGAKDAQEVKGDIFFTFNEKETSTHVEVKIKEKK